MTNIKLFSKKPSELNLKRCTKCILPHTHPSIWFDDEGVCSLCNAYQKPILKGKDQFLRDINQYRSKDGSTDVIVAFSGGRDSSYGLDYIKTELRMNPIAFTYEWGMTTELAERNQKRVCDKLSVDHELVMSNVKKKRENIRKNVEAWLKKPDLGMVPLFMAGDKQFYYYAHKLRKKLGVKLVVFCAGNEFEGTYFKTGFMGLGNFLNRKPTNLTFTDKAKMVLYYLKQYITNPAYLNSSLFDTIFAWYSMFVLKDDYLYLYKYIPWDEDKINTILKDKFEWEVATDIKATWRIGDGTAAFYNYIYYTVAGFSEFDEMRSNQVRAGVITREQALEMLEEDNKPRLESLEWYADVIGIDLKHTIDIINKIPKRWENDS